MSEKQLNGEVCKVCGKPATGFESRFGYYYCKDHENTPPVKIYEESLKYGKAA